MGRDRDHPARRRRVARGSRWLPTLLVLAVLGGAGTAYVVDESRGDASSRTGPETSQETSPETGPEGQTGLPDPPPPDPVLDPVPADDAGSVDAARVLAALTPALSDNALGRRVSAVVGDLDGESTAVDLGGGPLVPASTTKLLTGVAVLDRLGPDHRFTTRVVAGPRPRDVVLVGGGDPYLEREPEDAATSGGDYPARADLVSLARATVASLGGRTRVRVSYDDSLFTGPSDNPAWPRDYLPDGVVSPITALWVDGGRDEDGFGRVDDPSRAAAAGFAQALREQGVEVAGRPRAGVADPAAAELASASGAPLSQVVERMLDTSDNESAEVLAHHVGIATAGEGSFVAGAAGTLETLQALGVPLDGARILDGSGLSRRNLLDPESLLAVLRLASAADRPDLRAVLTGLPVAGFTGSLASRFEQGSALGRGSVRAKTGTLSGVHLLAGVVTDRDGDTMVFAMGADRVRLPRTLDARAALDRAAAALAACRCAADQ